MINYTYRTPQDAAPEIVDVKTLYRCETVRLDASNLPAGFVLPSLCPISVDLASRQAVVCKRVRLYNAADSKATAIQVTKGHPMQVGDVLSDGVVSAAITAISSSANYDTLTISLAADLEEGAVLFQSGVATEAASAEVEEGQEAPKAAISKSMSTAKSGASITPLHVANFMNYQSKLAADKDFITPIAQAYSIKQDLLVVPVVESDKALLTSRFMFV